MTSVDLDPFNPDILLDDTVQMTGEVAYSDYPHTEVSVGTLSSADTGSVTVTQYDGNNEATITAVAPPDVDGERVTIKDRDYYDPIDEFGNPGWVEGYTHVLSGCGNDSGNIIWEYADEDADVTPDCDDFSYRPSTTHFSLSDIKSGHSHPDYAIFKIGTKMENLYDEFAYSVSSVFRCPYHNAHGISPAGVENSHHIYGDAFDLDTNSESHYVSANNAAYDEFGSSACASPEGFYDYDDHLHVDFRKSSSLHSHSGCGGWTLVFIE